MSATEMSEVFYRKSSLSDLSAPVPATPLGVLIGKAKDLANRILQGKDTFKQLGAALRTNPKLKHFGHHPKESNEWLEKTKLLEGQKEGLIREQEGLVKEYRQLNKDRDSRETMEDFCFLIEEMNKHLEFFDEIPMMRWKWYGVVDDGSEIKGRCLIS